MAKDSLVSLELDKGFMKTCKDLISKIPECAERAERDAIDKGVSALTDTKGGMPSIYNVKKKDMAQYIKKQKDTIKVRSRTFTTVHFGFTPKQYTSQAGMPVKRRQKSTITVMKGGKKSTPHAFIANPASINGGTVMLWKRGKGKRSIEPVRSVSAAQMAQNDKVSEYVEAEMAKRFNERLEHYYDRIAVGGKK